MKTIEEQDRIKEQILFYLNEVLNKARNENMAKVTDAMIIRELKNKGYESNEVTKELIYLVSAGKVKKLSETYTVETTDYNTGKNKSIKMKQIYYIISDKGIDFVEGDSKFKRSSFIGGINIGNIQGALVLGENNTVIVNQQHYDIYKSLTDLEEAVKTTTNISDDDKAEYLGDITTLKGQIAKKKPNVSIVKLAWSAISALSTIEGLNQFIERVSPLIQKFIK